MICLCVCASPQWLPHYIRLEGKGSPLSWWLQCNTMLQSDEFFSECCASVQGNVCFPKMNVCVWEWREKEGRWFERKSRGKGWGGQIVERGRKWELGFFLNRVYRCWTVWPAGWIEQWKADGWKCVCLSSQPNRAMERDRAMNSLAVDCVCVFALAEAVIVLTASLLWRHWSPW